jgi:citrate synthase
MGFPWCQEARNRLRAYRGVDMEELVGAVPFEQVWGLLVDGTLEAGLPAAEPHALAVRSGTRGWTCRRHSGRNGVSARSSTSPTRSRGQLARASAMARSFVAQSARGFGRPLVPQRLVDEGRSIPERFLIPVHVPRTRRAGATG